MGLIWGAQAVSAFSLLKRTCYNVGELNSGANGRLGSGFKDRATLTAVYDIGPIEATWRVNYLSSINDTNPTTSNTVISALYNHVPSYVYNDVQLRYTFNEKRHSSVYVGANNLFNKQPPFLPGGMASEITGTETVRRPFPAKSHLTLA
jgi:iron complex outermembrane recepter protein